MTCYHPMTLFRAPWSDIKTKKSPMRGLRQGGNPNDPVVLPCGKCWGCRLERSRQWAIRCLHESSLYDRNCFVTLTYNTDALTWGANRATLYPKDLQLFFKRLRKKFGEKIRFFACGEYGEEKGRPHYHACIFNHDFDDKKEKLYERNKVENPVYTSETLAKLWPHGSHLIGEVTFESAAYVARYIMKKNLGPSREIYEREGYAPEFTRMSRRPGIGTDWYKKFKNDVFNYDKLILRGGIQTRPPIFYNKKYELDEPENYAIIKEARKKMALKQAEKTGQPSLKSKEEIKCRKIKQLLRSLN